MPSLVVVVLHDATPTNAQANSARPLSNQLICNLVCWRFAPESSAIPANRIQPTDPPGRA
jgi:hypothetical protein